MWPTGTCELPVLAAVEDELGVLVTISWRLKLRPCSRLLAEGAAHKHKDLSTQELLIFQSAPSQPLPPHRPKLDGQARSPVRTHVRTHAHECNVQRTRFGTVTDSDGARGDQWWCLFKYVVRILCSHLVFQTLTSLFKAVRSALCVDTTALSLAAQFEDANRRAGQDRTEIPWAVAGACAWVGVEDPDTMQVCTLLKELEPGDRAPDISERLPDLQWHT